MKQLVSNIRSFVSDRVMIIRVNVVNSFREETAFWTNNWGNVISTTLYTATNIAFINILYANVKTIAGYSYQEMLLFFLVGQITFYTTWAVSALNARDLIRDVNRGNLDLLLVKPVPSLFMVSLKRISIVSTVRDSLPTLLAILYILDWSAISPLVSSRSVVASVLIWVCGLFCVHVYQLLLVLPAFKFGEAGELFSLVWTIDDFGRIPFEGFGRTIRFFIGIILPVVIATGFTVSVFLGKSNPVVLFSVAIGITMLAMTVRHRSWKWALKQYTSASS